MGPGAHVREGTILEEGARAAHTVGLKQTILFPFVTLGSLINFCDCLMSGGTSHKNHSEVGSSFIHFNYTPNQDKATPSLLGDVPNGVMLDQPPIFLGGQGAVVGPCRLTFGTVTAAGTICRKDELRPGRLIFDDGRHGGSIPFIPGLTPNITRIARNNIIYIANLVSLKQWYSKVRTAFISEEFPKALHDGITYTLHLAIQERFNRFESFCGKLSEFGSAESKNMELIQRRTELCAVLLESLDHRGDGRLSDSFQKTIATGIQTNGKDYISVIRGLNDREKKLGKRWLQGIVDDIFFRTTGIMPSLKSCS
jgi:UDP-N-acetylglucosamine/UDP-N-acetylgalactosamine diphosphorylase